MNACGQLIGLMNKMSDYEINCVLAYAKLLAENEDIPSEDEIRAIRETDEDKNPTISHESIDWN